MVVQAGTEVVNAHGHVGTFVCVVCSRGSVPRVEVCWHTGPLAGRSSTLFADDVSPVRDCDAWFTKEVA